MTWKIMYSEESEKDLKAIYEYISYELCSPQYAVSQVERIMNQIRSLEHMPMRHKVYEVKPWETIGVRFVSVDNYIIFYLPKEDTGIVHILRIIYSGRDIEGQIKETKTKS